MDVVFVSIDFEGNDAICGIPFANKHGRMVQSINCEAGLAILDPRDLELSSFESAIKTRQLTAGRGWYCDIVPTRLVHGTSEILSKHLEFGPRLTDLLRFTSADGTLRPIVVIGFSLHPNSSNGDIACIERLTDPRVRSPIIDYLDVSSDQSVIREFRGYDNYSKKTRVWTPSLMKLLEYLAIPYRNLHIAANVSFIPEKSFDMA